MQAVDYICSKRLVDEYIKKYTVYYYKYGNVFDKIYYFIIDDDKYVISSRARTHLIKLIEKGVVTPVHNQEYQ